MKSIILIVPRHHIKAVFTLFLQKHLGHIIGCNIVVGEYSEEYDGIHISCFEDSLKRVKSIVHCCADWVKYEFEKVLSVENSIVVKMYDDNCSYVWATDAELKEDWQGELTKMINQGYFGGERNEYVVFAELSKLWSHVS